MDRLWVDANVILRFLRGEPAKLAGQSRKLMSRAERGEVTLVISSMIVAEVFWVLRSVYRMQVGDIVPALIEYLSARGIEVEELAVVTHALELTADKNVDYIDSYLALKAAQHHEKVCTFDSQDFNKLPVVWVSPE
jgi:predicted nucleic acid-binding protein